jgi:hypothetical protein
MVTAYSPQARNPFKLHVLWHLSRSYRAAKRGNLMPTFYLSNYNKWKKWWKKFEYWNLI